MDSATKAAHVIDLTNLPACEPNTSNASVLQSFCRSETHQWVCVWIAYEAKGPNWPNDDDVVALVRLVRAAYVIANGPNDEALKNHRYFHLGLTLYSLQEIVNSPWIEEVLTMLDRDRTYAGPRGLRHFVFALKETTVDCIAESAEFIGLFPTHKAAMAAALSETDR